MTESNEDENGREYPTGTEHCIHCGLKLTKRNFGFIGHNSAGEKTGHNECLSCMDQMDSWVTELFQTRKFPSTLYLGNIPINPEDVSDKDKNS